MVYLTLPRRGHTAIVNALVVAARVNVNADNVHRDTPLHLAIKNGHTDAMNALLAVGANVNVKDYYGKAPLHWAAMNGPKDVVEVLLQNNADINARSEQGWTPLHLAAIHGSIGTINVLIDGGADIEARDELEWTPLCWVVKLNHEGVTEVLIQRILIQDFSTQKPDYLKDASSTYWDKCKNKIEGKIGNSNTSYLDLLKADEDEIATRMINDEIKKTINELNYEGEFSIIESQIKNKFCEGMKRRELIDDGTGVIQRLDNDRNLPPEISEKIAFYLPNSDLENLQHIGNNSENAHVKPSTKMDETREEQGITENGRNTRQALLHG